MAEYTVTSPGFAVHEVAGVADEVDTILFDHDVVSVDQRTTTGCRVTVKNTALVSLGGVLLVTVIALKL